MCYWLPVVSLVLIAISFVMVGDRQLGWFDMALAAGWGAVTMGAVAQLARKRSDDREARVKAWTDQLVA
ncbi:hypothetical protein [Prescottella equi]|uniref:hypothetical protein n=1 Tax=Rhodococcus hoagii TaxID=43767 RepID=UPI00301DDA5C